METIIEGIQLFIDWMNTGIYVFFEDLLKEAVAWFVIAKIKFQIWALTFAWEVAKTIIFNLNIGMYIEQSFSQIDSMTMGYLNFFRIPDCVNLLVQAAVTRITLSVMGW
jgi:hypothetical protein